MSKSDERLITERYAAGDRTGVLAEEFGLPKQAIAKIVRRNGGEVRGRGANRLSPENEAEMVRLYADGVPLSELRRLFGVHVTSVPRVARRHGVQVRPQRRPHRVFADAEVVEMGRLWNDEGLSQTGIAKRFGTTQSIVSSVLRSVGITPVARHAVRCGEDHPSWKGGRSADGNGYILIHLSGDDQMASMRSRSGYVREHRLVMARYLGRPLRRSESVHHINGIRTDNRLENLQLYHGVHGPGVALRCADCGSVDIVSTELKAAI